MLKRLKIVITTVKEKAENCLVSYFNGTMSFSRNLLTKAYLQSAGSTAYHLYFISDEPIQEGDWVYNTKYQATWHRIGTSLDITEFDFKIIATTNLSLKYQYDAKTSISENWSGKNLPTPDMAFILHYITEYNNRKIIDSVNVEYIEKWFDKDGMELLGNFTAVTDKTKTISTPLINKDDNTITIKLIKDSWNIDELKQKCWEAYVAGVPAISPQYLLDVLMPGFEKWWKEQNI